MESVITLRYRSCDGYSEKRTFKTLEGAQKYAFRMVGNADLSTDYAVSTDGIGTIRVSGCSLYDLFPKSEPVEDYSADYADEGETGNDRMSYEDRELEAQEAEFYARMYGEW